MGRSDIILQGCELRVHGAPVDHLPGNRRHQALTHRGCIGGRSVRADPRSAFGGAQLPENIEIPTGRNVGAEAGAIAVYADPRRQRAAEAVGILPCFGDACIGADIRAAVCTGQSRLGPRLIDPAERSSERRRAGLGHLPQDQKCGVIQGQQTIDKGAILRRHIGRQDKIFRYGHIVGTKRGIDRWHTHGRTAGKRQRTEGQPDYFCRAGHFGVPVLLRVFAWSMARTKASTCCPTTKLLSSGN